MGTTVLNRITKMTHWVKFSRPLVAGRSRYHMDRPRSAFCRSHTRQSPLTASDVYANVHVSLTLSLTVTVPPVVPR
jgi:hypothetical protein